MAIHILFGVIGMLSGVLALKQLGAGPPLVLVHGLGAANPIAWPATPMLAEHFTVISPDRRGRRASGDGPEYALQREFEDIAVLVDSFKEPVSLLGHSWGGALALEAALLTHHLERLILYEAGIEPPEKIPEMFDSQLQALLDSGEYEQVMIALFGVGIDPEDVQVLRASPSWPDRVASAPTVPREVRASMNYRFDPERFKNLHAPTLLLLGENSLAFDTALTEQIHTALRDSRIVVLPGQQHLAMYTAPELFLKEVLAFLDATG